MWPLQDVVGGDAQVHARADEDDVEDHCREFRDVVFEDAGFEHHSFLTLEN